LGLAFFDQHDRHALADVLARHLLEDARAAAVEVYMDRGLVAALIESRLCVVDAVAGQHDLPAHQHLAAVAFGEEVAAERRLAAERLLECAWIVVDHPDLERGCAAENVLRARGILNAGELHHYPIGPLLLTDRL